MVDGANHARLGLKPRANQAGLGLGLQPGVHQDRLGLSHGVNLLRVGLGRKLASREGEGGLGRVVQEARLGQGDKDISLGLVDVVAPTSPVLGVRIAGREDLLVARLRAGHVDFIGGGQDPAEQHLLQLHPQDVAVLLRWDRRDSHPQPAGTGGGRRPRVGWDPHLHQDVAALVARGEDDGTVRAGIEPVEADGAVGHIKAGAELVCGDTVGTGGGSEVAQLGAVMLPGERGAQRPSPVAWPLTKSSFKPLDSSHQGTSTLRFWGNPTVIRHTPPQGELGRGGGGGSCPLTHDFEADGAAASGICLQLHAVIPAVVAVPQEREGGSRPRGQEEKQQEEGAAPSHGGGSKRVRRTGLSVAWHRGSWIYTRPTGTWWRGGGESDDRWGRVGTVPPAPRRGE